MNTQTNKNLFKIGQELTKDELLQAYERITGNKPKGNIDLNRTAQYFAQTQPIRFEFEVNRCRGYAWDNGDHV